MSSSFGQLFVVTTFGESHGPALGVVVDGMPPGIAVDEAAIQRDLDRRRPGQSALTTQRKESDKVEIVSGIFESVTLGTPIAMVVVPPDCVAAVWGFPIEVAGRTATRTTTSAPFEIPPEMPPAKLVA